jgi:hypothetical protein
MTNEIYFKTRNIPKENPNAKHTGNNSNTILSTIKSIIIGKFCYRKIIIKTEMPNVKCNGFFYQF